MKLYSDVNVKAPGGLDNLLSGTYEVVFDEIIMKKPVKESWITTICVIRKKHGIPFSGATCFNPNDHMSDKIGEHYALRRAVASALIYTMYLDGKMVISKDAAKDIRRQFIEQTILKEKQHESSEG